MLVNYLINIKYYEYILSIIVNLKKILFKNKIQF